MNESIHHMKIKDGKQELMFKKIENRLKNVSL